MRGSGVLPGFLFPVYITNVLWCKSHLKNILISAGVYFTGDGILPTKEEALALRINTHIYNNNLVINTLWMLWEFCSNSRFADK